MQPAVFALTRALKEKDFAVLAPFLDERFHVDQLTGGIARQVLQQAVAAGHVPTALHVEHVVHEGGLVRAATRFDYPDTSRTLTLTLTEAGKFLEIPLVQVRMTGGAGIPPGASVGGLRMSAGAAMPATALPAASAGRPPSNPALRDELLRMRQKDQEIRSRIPLSSGGGGSVTIDAETRRLMAQSDSENVARLRAIIARYGWPGASMVGQDGSQAAFLVLQHADRAAQEQYLPMLRAAAARNEVSPALLAMLEDRVRLRRGEKQLYGTQVQGNRATGRMELWPVEDEAHVDARRAAVGLPPLAQYLAAFGIEWSPPAAAHP